MEKGRNLAIFDFCDTLINFQSADEFCRFTLKRKFKYGSYQQNKRKGQCCQD